jgi:hypothetical protein
MAYKKGSKEAKAHMAKVRASKISGVKKKAVAKKTTTRKKAVAKKPVNISYDNSWGKYLDSNRKAKPAGKRISAEGNVYYEYRRNRTDVNQKAKKGQMLGVKYIFPQTEDLDKNFYKIIFKKINAEISFKNNNIDKILELDNLINATSNIKMKIELRKLKKAWQDFIKESNQHLKELEKLNKIRFNFTYR